MSLDRSDENDLIEKGKIWITQKGLQRLKGIQRSIGLSINGSSEYEYDIALSFAGEDREYVEQVAESLRQKDVSVFYDDYEQTDLWGKDLYVHLDEVYRFKAQYCLMFLSRHYARKLWTNHERESAQARAFSEHGEYILPVRFDDTQIPGIRPTTGYLDLRTISPSRLAEMVVQKLESTPVDPQSDTSPVQIPTARPILKIDTKPDIVNGVAINRLRFSNIGDRPLMNLRFRMGHKATDSDFSVEVVERLSIIVDNIRNNTGGHAAALGVGGEVNLYDDLSPELLRIIVIEAEYTDQDSNPYSTKIEDLESVESVGHIFNLTDQ